MKQITLLSIFIFYNIAAICQNKTNKIGGHVIDYKTREQLIGANVTIPSLHTGTVAKLDGSFQFNNLNLGTYLLKCSSVGYHSLDTTIQIYKAENNINLLLKSNATLNTVVINGSQDGSSESFAGRREQRSDNLTNILSAHAIKISPDITEKNPISFGG